MSELDNLWAEAVLTACPHLNVAHKGPSCTCGQPFEYEGIRYTPVCNAGCPIHGCKSSYIPQPGSSMKERSPDMHRHSAHSVKEDS